jgi:uncharacterized Zn-finger protein
MSNFDFENEIDMIELDVRPLLGKNEFNRPMWIFPIERAKDGKICCPYCGYAGKRVSQTKNHFMNQHIHFEYAGKATSKPEEPVKTTCLACNGPGHFQASKCSDEKPKPVAGTTSKTSKTAAEVVADAVKLRQAMSDYLSKSKGNEKPQKSQDAKAASDAQTASAAQSENEEMECSGPSKPVSSRTSDQQDLDQQIVDVEAEEKEERQLQAIAKDLHRGRSVVQIPKSKPPSAACVTCNCRPQATSQ